MANEQEKIEIKKEPAELTDLEVSASEKGWVPEKEWDGDPTEWRSAREFLDRGELMDRISSQTKQINQYDTKIQSLENSLKQLAEHNKKVAEMEYEKAIGDLKKKKADALDLGDHNAVVELDDKMSDLKQSRQEANNLEQANQPVTPHPDVISWMNENTWYNTDVALRGAADAIAQQYLAANPAAEANPMLVLAHVTDQLFKEFPEKLGPKTRPSATVEPQRTGSTKNTSKQKKWSRSDLNDMQKEIMKNICSEEFTEQEYINQLGELGELS
jgi:vacuolar-type H+-ATPase subunit I/STV1